ncbi:RICIN domain-containing protein [Actinomadura physcomitrii]|uniref:RICIN domain-containing protein n=1 Tax=Actinomadura physcomitrii TaxID=2650748 RepID=UPI00136AD723|nr:RICIN domain-containing protein [Actinomadura physcomitrii]
MKRLIAWLAGFLLLAGVAVVPGTASAAPLADPGQTYQIVEVTSGNVLGAMRTGDDPPMTVDAYDNNPNQLWRVADIGGGYSEIVNEGTGKALSTVNGQSGNGAVVHLWDYLSTFPDQHWRLNDQGDGTVTVNNQGTGERLLSTADGKTEAGTATQLWDRADGRAGQVWKLVPTALTRDITVHTDDVVNKVPKATVATGMEDVNHEIYGGIYSQMIFGEAFQEPASDPGVSGMWRSFESGSAAGAYSFASPFKGTQSQRLTFSSGTGSIGIENRGLNRQGLGLVGGRPYEGKITLRAETSQKVRVSFQSADGSKIYARTDVTTSGTGWKTYAFTLTPSESDTHGRFAIQLTAPGTVDAGYVFVEPGTWGRYKGLHVRKDVADMMVAQGLQAIRFGGCANSGCGDVSDYKWKKMVGDPVDRPVTKGIWYPYESNGWGIFDFLQLGEAMGIEAVPSLNIDEKPSDIADLMDYLYGPATTEWGAKRVADGHPQPYTVKRIELGNENAVNDDYWTKFKAIADVVWARDPSIRLVVGDFSYSDVITDPFHFTGGGKVNTLAAHQKILNLAKQYNAEVDFDIHLWTGQTSGVLGQIKALDSYAYQLGQIAPGAKYKVVVFELNADSHDLARGLANAYAINALQRRPAVDVVSSANALQVEGQNDNGWNQGLVFMNQSQVWGQPPYYVHQMKAGAYRPNAVRTDVTGADEASFDVTSMVSDDRKSLSVDVVNASSQALQYTVTVDGFTPTSDTVSVVTLSGRTNGSNTATNPLNIAPRTSSATLDTGRRTLTYTFEPNSYTSLRFAGAQGPVTEPSASATTMTIDHPSTTYGAPAKATVNVTAEGDDAAGAVRFSVDGRDLGTRTLAQGTVTAALPADLGVGTHVVKADYLGVDGKIAPSSTSGTQTVTQADATAKATLQGKGKAAELLVQVSIKGASDAVKAAGTVEVYVRDKRVGTAVLHNGAAVVDLPKLKKRDPVRAVYLGDANVGKAVSNTVTYQG